MVTSSALMTRSHEKNSFLWLNSSSSFSSLQLLINMHAFCMQIAYLAGGVSVPHISQVYLHNGTYACDWAISGALRMTGEESDGTRPNINFNNDHEYARPRSRRRTRRTQLILEPRSAKSRDQKYTGLLAPGILAKQK